MSVGIDSELARHHANLADVAASPANQYGLAHGYAIMPDPNDPYGWQAFEEERARQKCLAGLAQQQSLHTLSTSSTTAATTTTRSTRSCSSSLSCCSSSSCEEGGDEDSGDDDCGCDNKKKKKKCGGAWCRRKSLSFQRSSPHWCDGKKWGGKIWGLSRAPGDVRFPLPTACTLGCSLANKPRNACPTGTCILTPKSANPRSRPSAGAAAHRSHAGAVIIPATAAVAAATAA